MRNMLKNMMLKAICNQKGVSEVVQYGGLTILTCIILASVAALIAPSLDTGIGLMTGRITSAFTTIAGL